jgi:hypothetical protein
MAQHHDFKVKNGLVVADSGTFGNTLTGTDAVFSGSIAATGTISGSNLPVSFIDSAYVTSQIDAVIDAAPGALDTLNELAAALGDDANFSATITNAIAALPDSSQVSAIILNDVDSAYIQLRQSTTDAGLDSALTTQLIDSAYVQLRQTSQDFAYSSLTGAPTNVSQFTNDAGYLTTATASGIDSATAISVITAEGFTKYDSANTTGMLSTYASQTYVTNAIDNLIDGAPGTLDTLNEIAAALNDDDSAYGTLLTLINTKTNYDSANTLGLIDSAYIQLRQSASGATGLDSALTIQLIDSAYIQARQTGGGTADSGTIAGISSRVWRMDSLGELDLLNTHTGLGVPNGDAKVGDIAYKLGPFDGYVLTDISAPASYINTGFVLHSLSGSTITRLPFATVPTGQLPSQNFAVNQSIAISAAGLYARIVGAVSDTGGALGKGYIDVTSSVPGGYPSPYGGSTIYASTAAQTTWKTFGIDSAIVTSLSASGGLDSASVTELVDSAYVQLRTKTTAIVTVSASKFVIDGSSQPIIKLQPGRTYRFDQSNPSNANHPLRFSITNDGTHNSGSAYTTGVTENGTPGNVGAYTEIEVDFATPALYYYCGNHSGMGGASDAVYQSNVFTSIYVSGQDVFNADSARDKLIFEAGTGITLTTDANTDTLTISGHTEHFDSANVIALIDSAYVQARQSNVGGGGGGIDSASTITLIEATVDSDYIGTKVDFTRGEFYNNHTLLIADSNQTVFNYTSLDPANLDVYLNGLLLPSNDYAATTSAVTITVGTNLNDEVQIVEKRGRILTQRGLVENKYYFTTPTPSTSITGTDDNGTTLDYSDGFLDVYLNGILLKDSDDYSTNAGTTVTLVSATDSNDIVTLINRKGVVVSPNVKNYEFTADSAQTLFTGSDINGNTLSYVPDAVQVHLNGILLRNLDYTAINGSSILLAAGATATDEIVISAFSNPGQNMDLYQFTADSGQTIFHGNDLQGKSLAYMPGNIQVFLNGLLLNDSDDYNAINGISVNLTSGADASDEIKIAAFTVNTNYTPLNQWVEPSFPYSASAGDKIFVDTSSAKTITLPSTATMGEEIRIVDATGNAATNNITVARNGHNILGNASDLTMNIDRSAIGLVYYNVTQGWILIEN